MARRRGPVVATLALAVLSLVTLLGARRTAPGSVADKQVLYGRYLVITHDCGGCHGGDDNPTSAHWLAGEVIPQAEFKIGPCTEGQPCFHTHPRNLTPDNETGLGRFTERQIFNALRYGLRPEDTPDVTITSTTPGKGNFPLHPHYLAVPMPWPAWRHMPDADLKAIAAYLHRGLKPVHHKVPDSEGPPDFWASTYAQGIPPLFEPGPAVSPAFPTEQEQAATASVSAPGKH